MAQCFTGLHRHALDLAANSIGKGGRSCSSGVSSAVLLFMFVLARPISVSSVAALP
jgi:hypothetical protein